MRKVFFILPLFCFLIACDEINEGGFRILIPWPDDSGQYSLEVVSINSLDNVTEVSGSAAKLFVYPGLSAAGINSIPPNALLTKTTDGYYRPDDTITQEMFAIYAHMERLKRLDENLGIGRVMRWPRQIGVETIGVDAKTHKHMYENAMYVHDPDVMIFFPFRDKSKLAVSLNAGVIAHEHFHSIFQHIVINPLIEKYGIDDNFLIGSTAEDKMDEDIPLRNAILNVNFAMIRAFNEGLADIWGSIYTNNYDFISDSLPNTTRSTKPTYISDFPLQRFVPRIFLANRDYLVSQAYDMGTVFARVMQKALEQEGLAKASKLEKGAFVIDRLYRLRKTLLEVYMSGIKADHFLEAIYLESELDADKCKWFSPLLDASDLKKVCDSKILSDDLPKVLKVKAPARPNDPAKGNEL